MTKQEAEKWIGVTSGVTSEIRAAFNKSALKYHPDRNPGDSVALETWHKLSLARDILLGNAPADDETPAGAVTTGRFGAFITGLAQAASDPKNRDLIGVAVGDNATASAIQGALGAFLNAKPPKS
jgi:DnaJ-class molecular chaperone